MPFPVARLIIAVALLFAGTGALAASSQTWTAPDPGLLRDAAFEADQPGQRRAWSYSQHAGKKSYLFDTVDGVLRIERTGTEPWGMATQRIKAKDLAGRTLEFSAELSGEFPEMTSKPIASTGVVVRVVGYKPDLPRMLGKSNLLVGQGEPGLTGTKYDWPRQHVRFTVPDGATDIDVSIVLGRPGQLSARGPQLIDVDSTPPATAER